MGAARRLIRESQADKSLEVAQNTITPGSTFNDFEGGQSNRNTTNNTNVSYTTNNITNVTNHIMNVTAVDDSLDHEVILGVICFFLAIVIFIRYI